MIRLRHILHPFRSARTLYGKTREFVQRRLDERKFAALRREKRDRCWCGGALAPFESYPSFGLCVECGCYVNRRPPREAETRRLYSFDLYWHVRQRLKNHPAIEARPENDRGDGRVKYWLDLIERHAGPRGRVVEVGCGSGVLLADLKARGYECIGVEPEAQTAEWVGKKMGVEVRAGFFPEIDLPDCDLFLAFDVIEHARSPESFVRGAARLLKPGGIAIIQTPIPRDSVLPPFGRFADKVFDDVEHLFILSDRSLCLLAERAGLSAIGHAQWALSHEIVVLKKAGP